MSDNNITIQNLSLPKGGGALQGISEKFQMQEFTGSSSFTIPLAATSCRGITPQLAVGYSSGSGNNTFGIGWSLNLPQITRKTSAGIPKYNSEDIFILSGGSELVPLPDEVRESKINEIVYNIQRFVPRNLGSVALIELWQSKDNSFWKVTERDHTISIFGFTETAKISNPDNEEQVFSWLLEETYNDKGDHQLLFYKQENPENIEDKFSKSHINTANRYIERICYGQDKAVPDSMVFLGKQEESKHWHFELVFNYGEYDIDPKNINPYEPSTSWESRPDPFSTFNAGFEIRTFRRCLSTLMFHRFEELGEIPRLVNVTKFNYSQATSLISRLTSSNIIGYSYENNTYKTAAIPETEFEYTEFKPEAGVFKNLTDIHDTHLPGLNETLSYNFVDLFGEGIAGILYSNDRVGYYSSPTKIFDEYTPESSASPLYNGLKQGQNEGVKYQPWKILNSFPSFRQISNDVALMDITGNGQMDLVIINQNIQGYFQANSDSSWSKFHSFEKFVTNYHEPFYQWVDMTGNGLNDLLRIDRYNITYYPSEREKGLTTPKMTSNTDNIPSPSQSAPNKAIRFADMDGSGMQQLVIIEKNRVSYRPNLGYGKFAQEIVMSSPPQFDEKFDTNRLFIVDVDGSGTGDLLYIQEENVTLYINSCGNAFLEPIKIKLPIKFNDTVKIAFADVNGRGTACLIISDYSDDLAPCHYYYDFCQGEKPYLINKTCNNMGASTEIKYGTSVDFYLADKKAGLPWVTSVPFPVHVVTQVTAIDEITGSRLVSQYAYHHGYYDGIEREFRGFGRIDTQVGEYFADVKEGDYEYTAPSLTRTWYNLGSQEYNEALLKQYKKEYYQGAEFEIPDNIIDYGNFTNINDRTKHLAYTALAGSVLRSELYGLDKNEEQNVPYAVSQNNYKAQLVQPTIEQQYAIFLVYNQETISYNYERLAGDPQVHQQYILDVDRYGNILKSCSVAYPRQDVPGALEEQKKLHVTCVTQTYIHDTDPENYLIAIPLESKSYQVNGLVQSEDQSFQFDYLKEYLNNSKNLTLLDHAQTYYAKLNNDTSTEILPLGKISLPLLAGIQKSAIFHDTEVKSVFQDVLSEEELSEMLSARGYYNMDAEGYWWASSSTAKYAASDNFYLPLKSIDQAGNSTNYDYDKYNLTLVKITDPIGNESVIEEIDYRILSPKKLKDINNNISEVKVDPLGQVIYTSFYGTQQGIKVGFVELSQSPDIQPDNLQEILDNPAKYLGKAQSFYYYDLFAWKDRREPSCSLILSATNYPGAEDKQINIAINYLDGFGRTLQAKAKADPGVAFYEAENKEIKEEYTENRWLTSGSTIYNNKGKPVKQYEPYYFNSPHYVENNELARFGVTPTIYYDPLNRVTHTLLPTGLLLKTTWNAWETSSYDANDIITESPYYLVNYKTPDPSSPYYDKDFIYSGGKENLEYIVKYFANTPNTQIIDNLGRVIVTKQITKSPENADGEVLSTYSTYDIKGRILTSSDPRLSEKGIHNYQMTYGMSGGALKTVSCDAGTRLSLTNVFGNSIFTCNSRSISSFTEYDKLQRAISISVKDRLQGTTFVAERYIYGDSLNLLEAELYNLRGKIYLHYDPAGKIEFPSYGILGQVLTSRRTFLENYKIEPDWSNTELPKLLPRIYSTYISYDALGRVIEETDIDSNKTYPNYNLLGQLQSIKVTTPEETKKYVESISYNAKGQREQISYGNSTTTNYTYDLKTWAITEIKTAKVNSTDLQHVHYLYDPVGNVVQKTDSTQNIVYYKNQAVSPTSTYKYDSIYELVEATGRKKISKSSNIDQNIEGLSNLTVNDKDLAALENYLEKYSYDSGGNLVKTTHTASTSWVKTMIVSPRSNRAVISTINNNDTPPVPEDVDKYFDPCGNQIKTQNINPLGWDYRNQLRSVTIINREDENHQGGEQNHDVEYYVYDGAGHRVRKILETYAANETVLNIKETLYLGNIEIRTKAQKTGTDTTTTVTEEYHALRIQDDTGCIATKNYWLIGTPPEGFATPTIFYHLKDNLGSCTIEVSDTGEVVSLEEYAPYGGITIFIGSGSADQLKHYRYSGKERDSATGFYYYGARYYSSSTGRWLNPDPSGPVDGLNIYAFVNGNPVTFTDHNGRQKIYLVYPFHDHAEDFLKWIIAHNLQGNNLESVIIDRTQRESYDRALVKHLMILDSIIQNNQNNTKAAQAIIDSPDASIEDKAEASENLNNMLVQTQEATKLQDILKGKLSVNFPVGLETDEIVGIYGHCDVGLDYLSSDSGEIIKADELAKTVVNQGLSAEASIFLLSCNAAVSEELTPRDIQYKEFQKHNEAISSRASFLDHFTTALAREFGNKSNFRVTGSLGLVTKSKMPLTYPEDKESKIPYTVIFRAVGQKDLIMSGDAASLTISVTGDKFTKFSNKHGILSHRYELSKSLQEKSKSPSYVQQDFQQQNNNRRCNIF